MPRERRRGSVLVSALVMLVALMLGAAALMRMVESANLLSGGVSSVGSSALLSAAERDEAGSEARQADIATALARLGEIPEADRVIGNPAYNELLIYDNGGFAVEDGVVIATGGGIVLRPANRELLHQRTHCVYLKADPQALFHRLRRDTKRPLLQVPDPEARLAELSAEREPLYSEAATLVVETRARTLQMLVDAIVEKLPLSAVEAGRGSAP